MSEQCTRFVDGKFFLNDSGLTVSPKDGSALQRFLDYQMLSLNDHRAGVDQIDSHIPEKYDRAQIEQIIKVK